jgi:hypothetical protein
VFFLSAFRLRLAMLLRSGRRAASLLLLLLLLLLLSLRRRLILGSLHSLSLSAHCFSRSFTGRRRHLLTKSRLLSFAALPVFTCAFRRWRVELLRLSSSAATLRRHTSWPALAGGGSFAHFLPRRATMFGL